MEHGASSRDSFRGLIFKNHVYSAEQTDLVLPCSKTYRLDEKFVDTAKNQPLKVRKPLLGAAILPKTPHKAKKITTLHPGRRN